MISMLQLNSDIDEIKQLIGQANRLRVKQFLEIQQRRLETELIGLKEKKEETAASVGEKKPSAAVSSSTTRSYTKEITLYGKMKINKIGFLFLTNLSSSVGSIR
jgi:hypothetical protein